MAVAAEAKFHVLAVDDSVLDRKLIERLLTSSSYQVTIVDSVSKALEFLGLREDGDDSPSELLNNQEIDVNLVITDYCMPGMTGYDLLKRIKVLFFRFKEPGMLIDHKFPNLFSRIIKETVRLLNQETSPLKDIPVVIMSSENVPSRISRCMEQGAEEFFLKPMQISDIKRLIPHMMKGKQREEDQQPNRIEGDETSAIATAAPASPPNHSNSGNKRKTSSDVQVAMESSLSPDRTRQRFTVTA